MVVHNLCIDLDDHPEDILDYDPSDNTAGITDEDSEAELEPCPQYGTAFMQCIQVPGRETLIVSSLQQPAAQDLYYSAIPVQGII